MPRQAPPAPSPRLSLSPVAVLLIVTGAVILAAAAWTTFRQRREISILRAEVSSLTQAQRATASRESAAAAAVSRLGETEAALAKERAELNAVTAQSATRIAELDHLVTFLRSEVTAAQQTIERLKAPPVPVAPVKPAPVKAGVR
ncbi:MAG: hypothetical protein V4726_18545 [Verrucomicrobiota bacterium]